MARGHGAGQEIRQVALALPVAIRSEVVAAASDRPSHASHQHEYQADDQNNDPDGPQDADAGQESCDEEDNSDDYHHSLLSREMKVKH
jgi:hypothetical protein